MPERFGVLGAGRGECSGAANWHEHLAASMTKRGAVIEDKTLLYSMNPGRRTRET